MADKLILTHKKVRKLQRILYQQAKTKPNWKAWSLYGDICQFEFIEEAMSRVLKNKGGCGVDGYSVEMMETNWDSFRDGLQAELKDKSYRPSPVLRVKIPKSGGGERSLGIPTVKDRVVQMLLVLVLEPIFEANFHDESYGYRPQKKAQDAVGSISKALYYGKTVAIEADLSKYFDTVNHARLLKLIRGKVSDGAILKLVKQFLRVPAVEREKRGKERWYPNDKKGVPQGGVISPLLANLYLDKLDKAVNALDPSRVKMVRYADDFAILVQNGLEKVILERVRDWLEKAGLELNLTKTKITDIEQKGKVEFLGFELSERPSKKGKAYIHCQPSKTAQGRLKSKIREKLHRYSTWREANEVVQEVNRITRGWGNYFHHGHSQHSFRAMNYWLKERLRTWLYIKHKKRSRYSKYKVFPDSYLTEELGMYLLPSAPKWASR